MSRMNSRHPESTPISQAFPKLAATRQEAAQMLSVSPPTLDRLVQRGLLKPSRATRRPLFAIVELQRFLRETTG